MQRVHKIRFINLVLVAMRAMTASLPARGPSMTFDAWKQDIILPMEPESIKCSLKSHRCCTKQPTLNP